MKKIALLWTLLVVFSCSQPSKENPPEWNGEWQATWETDPASFDDMPGITDFTMPGTFTFENDSVTIKAFGFKGCVFNQDTLNHTLNWKVSGDSLILINDKDTPGMVYNITEFSTSQIGLELMGIFLTLKK